MDPRFADLVGKIQRLAGAHQQAPAAVPPPERVRPTRRGLPLYEPGDLWEEIAYLGYHLHWSLDELLDLEHRDRRYLVRQVAALNERAWEEVHSRA